MRVGMTRRVPMCSQKLSCACGGRCLWILDLGCGLGQVATVTERTFGTFWKDTVAVSAQEVKPCAEANGTPRALIRASCKHIQVDSSTYLRAMLVPRALTDASRKHKSRSRQKSEESKKVGATQIRRSSLRLLMLIASTHVRVLCTSTP